MQSGEEIKIMTPQMAAKIFGKLYRSMTPTSNLYLIVGPEHSGKSTIIDLLTEKQIIQVNDQELQIQKLQVQGSKDGKYPNIYIDQIQTNGIKNIFVESYTLADSHEYPQLNLMKSIFLKATADRLKNISIILAIEQSQKDQISYMVENLLHCFGITEAQLNENCEQLKKYCYLLLTKVEEEQSLQNIRQIITDILDEESSNPNVLQLLNTLNSDDRIMMFKNQTPTPQLPNEITTKFAPVEINEHFRKFISLQKAFNEVGLDELDQKYISSCVIKLMKIIIALVTYAIKPETLKTKEKSNYQNIIKSLYGVDENNKLDINKMIGQWDQSIVKDINLDQMDGEENADIFKYLINLGIRLAQSFKKGAQNSEEYVDIIGSMIFCQEMVQWIDNSFLQQSIKDLKNQLINCFKQIPSSSNKKPTDKKSTEPVSKVKQTARLSSFKGEINKNCKNNSEAIAYCLKIIKEKQKQPNFEWSGVIYYLKLLRQILKQYNSHKKQECFFAPQLLELYMYTDNFYDFDQLLDKYLQVDNIPIKMLMNVFRYCQALKWYQCCIKCANYCISNTVNDQTHDFFLKAKGKILYQYYQEYKNRSAEVAESSLESKKYDLQITMDNIKQKENKTKDLKTYLLADNFRKIMSQNSE